jgi:hypothetical protein
MVRKTWEERKRDAVAVWIKWAIREAMTIGRGGGLSQFSFQRKWLWITVCLGSFEIVTKRPAISFQRSADEDSRRPVFHCKPMGARQLRSRQAES